MTTRPLARPLVLIAMALLLVAPLATAETFIIQLHDGGSFQSRYQPQEASWDSETVLLLTEFGNWIALAKADIASTTTETENKGFGRVINTTTISLGLKTNDAPVPEEGEGGGQPSSADLLREFLNRPEEVYNVEQFVEPGDAGMSRGGLPATFGYGGGPSAPVEVVPISPIQ
jgi:hypothetical protein